MIKNKEHLAVEIMGQSRHQFIYGYNGGEREDFLKRLALNYPMTLDKSSPIGIYVCDKGLPEVPKNREHYDKIALQTFNRDYVDLLIVSSIASVALEQVDKKTLDTRSKELFDRFNKSFINENSKAVKTFRELKEIIDVVKDIYHEEYTKYLASCNLYDFKKDLRIKNIVMGMFVKHFKSMINSRSYVGVIFDQQETLALYIQTAINNYVGSRINGDISMKIACDPEEWKTYYGSNGVPVEAVHDYGIVKLDSSSDNYMQKIMKKRKKLLKSVK